ncbi:MAG: hypothetical protein ABJA64_00010, partial [Candidatus Saccharibacteria bacterium]
MNAYDLYNYSEKISKLLESFPKLADRVENDRSYSQDNFQSLVDTDPTSTKSYLRWIIDSYVNNGIKLYEDLLSRVKPALEDYVYLKSTTQLGATEKIIDNYCGIVGCTKKFKEKPGLESLIDKYEPALEHRREKIVQSAQIKEDTEQVFESDELVILQPKTEEASCYYGQGTKWCTAAKKNNSFNEYNKDGKLYILLPKTPQHEGEKYQLHFETSSFMDEKDESVYLLESDTLQILGLLT